MDTQKKLDLILILIWPIAAALISLATQAGLLVSTILFLGLPAFYLSFRYSQYVKKIIIFSLLLGIPIAIVADHVMEQTGGWATYSILGSFRLFDFVIVDQILWVILYLFLVGLFYEIFLDPHDGVQPHLLKIKPLAVFAGIVLGVFMLAHYFRPSLLEINYFYLKFGLLLGILPIIIALLKMPQIFGRLFQAAAYFFFLSLIYELTALYLGQWSFPVANQFIGQVNILGFSFPFEELLFWIILGSIAVIVHYEFAVDKKH